MATAAATNSDLRVPTNRKDRHELERIVSAGPYQPRNINFPKKKQGGRMRGFNKEWYDLQHAKPWLEYSIASDSMFCLSCRLFQSDGK